MSKLRVKPTIEESFAVGKSQGAREAFEELQELMNDGADLKAVQLYIRARLKSLVTSVLNNPFKQKDPK